MKTVLNIVIGFIVTITGIILFWFIVFSVSAFVIGEILFSDIPQSSKSELIENFEKNEKHILELKEYYNLILPKVFSVNIEFKSNKEIEYMFIWYPYISQENSSYIEGRDLKLDSSDFDLLIKELGMDS